MKENRFFVNNLSMSKPNSPQISKLDVNCNSKLKVNSKQLNCDNSDNSSMTLFHQNIASLKNLIV